MSGRHRTAVAALVLGAVLGLVVLVAFAGNACPAPTPANQCPDAARNVVVVIALAAATAALIVTPFAFLAEFATRRIVYRGAWWRAARRGMLVGLTLAILAGLRLGGALTVPVAIFVVLLAIVVERATARLDG